MKKIVIAVLLSAFAATSALAADMSVGASYGLGGVSGSSGVLSVRGDYDISEMANQMPVKARVGFDRYSIGYGGNYTWAYNIFYGGAYYDFSEALNWGEEIHPFAGLGFGVGSASCSGSGCRGVSTPSSGGLYYIGGIQYNVAPNIDAELGFSGWSGISIGANFKF